MHLSVFLYFAVNLPQTCFEDAGESTEFLKRIRLCDSYRAYVYDDSINIVAMAIGKDIFPYVSTTPDNLYIQYITKLKPDYVFEYLYSLSPFPLYFCYKDDRIIVVRLSDDGNEIISYPFSEFKNWNWLNGGRTD